MFIDDGLAQFVVQLRADGRSVHTIKQYERHIHAFATWASEAGHTGLVADVDHATIASFMASPAARQTTDGRDKLPTSVNALRTSLRCFFGYLHEVGAVPANPARRLRLAACAPPPVRAMSDADYRRLVTTLEAAEGTCARRDLALVRLLGESGVRLGAAISLDIEDLDLDAGEARLTRDKGAARTTVLLPASLCDHLRDYVDGRTSGPLFAARGGRRLSVRQAQHRFARWLARAGVERRVPPHSLRHAFAIRLYQRTRDLFLVQQALGHASIASTTTYARADRGRLREAIG